MFDHSPLPANRSGPQAADAPLPAVLRRTPDQLCGRVAGPPVMRPANQNEPTAEGLLFEQLPDVIRAAVDEWAQFLRARPWRFRRAVMSRFAEIFAEQFRQHAPAMSREDVEGMKEIGFTCLLERLDSGRGIDNLHQARLYLDSVHDRHREAARLFLMRNRPQSVAAVH